MASALQGAIEFLRDFGLFDIVLPFLFVFTIVFAILEKTFILGKDGDSPKKNLNAMVAFVIAFSVVSTNQIVNAINQILPNIVLLLVLSVSFLLLVGIFMKSGELDFKESLGKPLFWIFILIMFFGVLIIFLNSLEHEGQSWLSIGFEYIVQNSSGPITTTVILLVVMVGAIYWITKSGNGNDSGGNGN
jgi:hypothetical protein